MKKRISLAGALFGMLAASGMAARAEDSAMYFRFVSATDSVMVAGRDDGTAVWSNEAATVSGRFQRATSMEPTNEWLDYVQYAGTGTIVTQRLADWATPAGMAYVPGGIFQMGNTFEAAEGNSDELPVHTVFVSEFYMDKTEVTKGQWDETYNWALTNGYAFDNAGSWYNGTNCSKGDSYPVVFVNWYDCVKWCNARSEREGRLPPYMSSGAVFQAGQDTNVVCDWSAAGYRLPTEAEWEKAARGGARARRFPWADADTIDRDRANYYCNQQNGMNVYEYDQATTGGYDPTYTGWTPPTAPAGSFVPNGYGLHDMAGNVSEWCWDWYGSAWYNDAGAKVADTRGPALGLSRVFRGGDYHFYARHCRVAFRLFNGNPTSKGLNIGFRAVLLPSRQ